MFKRNKEDYHSNPCGGCSFFTFENVDGSGICQIKNVIVKCTDLCWLDFDNSQTIKVLHYYQKWRRGDKIPMPNSTIVGEAIDSAIHQLRQIKNCDEG